MQEFTTNPTLVHHPLIDRFAIECDGRRLAFLSYTLERRRTMTIDIVMVPPGDALHMSDRLLASALAWARDNNYTVLPFCPPAQEFVRRARELQPAAAAA
jgi:predicted GNAT family acetyltransferase